MTETANGGIPAISEKVLPNNLTEEIGRQLVGGGVYERQFAGDELGQIIEPVLRGMLAKGGKELEGLSLTGVNIDISEENECRVRADLEKGVDFGLEFVLVNDTPGRLAVRPDKRGNLFEVTGAVPGLVRSRMRKEGKGGKPSAEQAINEALEDPDQLIFDLFEREVEGLEEMDLEIKEGGLKITLRKGKEEEPDKMVESEPVREDLVSAVGGDEEIEEKETPKVIDKPRGKVASVTEAPSDRRDEELVREDQYDEATREFITVYRELEKLARLCGEAGGLYRAYGRRLARLIRPKYARYYDARINGLLRGIEEVNRYLDGLVSRVGEEVDEKYSKRDEQEREKVVRKVGEVREARGLESRGLAASFAKLAVEGRWRLVCSKLFPDLHQRISTMEGYYWLQRLEGYQ